MKAGRWFSRGRVLCTREDGSTLLAHGGIPGEELVVGTFVLGRRRTSRVLRVLTPAPSRVVPECPIAETCGGCRLLHVNAAEEAGYCRLTVAEVLSRFTRLALEPDDVEFVGASEDFGHRRRMTVHVAPCGSAIGLKNALGEVVDIPDCSAVSPALRNALHWLRSQHPSRALCGELLRLEAGDGGDLGILASSAASTNWLASCVSNGPFVGAALMSGKKPMLVAGSWPAQPSLAGSTLAPALGAWTQPNLPAAHRLYRWVASALQPEGKRILDATCGTGGLLFHLASIAESALGVDANWDALESARASARLNELKNVSFRGGKIETVAPKMLRAGLNFDATLINPMRRTLGERAMQSIGAMTTKRIVYLAPAPRAGADDIEYLLGHGWRCAGVAAVNLHPSAGTPMAAVILEPDGNAVECSARPSGVLGG